MDDLYLFWQLLTGTRAFLALERSPARSLPSAASASLFPSLLAALTSAALRLVPPPRGNATSPPGPALPDVNREEKLAEERAALGSKARVAADALEPEVDGLDLLDLSLSVTEVFRFKEADMVIASGTEAKKI